jgi:hypothetical protein
MLLAAASLAFIKWPFVAQQTTCSGGLLLLA